MKVHSPQSLRALLSICAVLVLAAAGLACGDGDDVRPERVAAAAGEEPGFFERLFSRRPVAVTVPAGTVVTVRMLDTASSHASERGEMIRAEVAEDVRIGGRIALPAGATVVGRVSDAHRPQIGGRARLRIDFASVELPWGASAPFTASVSRVGASEAGKDAAAIAGGVAAGAVLGHQVDDDEGKVFGGILGVGVGTGIAAHTEGEPLVIAAGSELELELVSATTVEIED